MTVADKLVYLSETKDLLADTINSYTQVITSDTPFREYAQWIDNIVFSAEGGIPSLFDSEAGFAWSGLPYYQDPAGTTVASWGNPVGLISDDSGNGVAFTQPTVTARPVLGRVPVGGRTNLYNHSEDVTLWESPQIAGVSIVSSKVIQAYPANIQHYIGPSYVVEQGQSYLFCAHVKSPPEAIPLLQITYTSGVFGGGYTNINLTTGAVTAQLESSMTVSVTPSDVVEGGWKVTSYGTASTGGIARFVFSFIPSADSTRLPTFLGGETYSLEVHRISLNLGVVELPYQKVTSRYDITESGVPSVHYIHLDGIDDSVATTLPEITNGTLILAGTDGIWIDDDFNHDGGAFTVGPTTYTGGPAGILPIVGDLIVGGSFAIDRQLTSQERARVINKLKSMGAPGVFELGPELVVNGDFSAEGLGWTVGSEWLVTSNRAKSLGTSGTTAVLRTLSQSLGDLTVGDRVVLSIHCSEAATEPTGAIRVFSGGSASNDLSHAVLLVGPSSGTYASITTTVGVTNVLRLLGSSNITGTYPFFDGAINNVSVRKLELVP